MVYALLIEDFRKRQGSARVKETSIVVARYKTLDSVTVDSGIIKIDGDDVRDIT